MQGTFIQKTNNYIKICNIIMPRKEWDKLKIIIICHKIIMSTDCAMYSLSAQWPVAVLMCAFIVQSAPHYHYTNTATG